MQIYFLKENNYILFLSKLAKRKKDTWTAWCDVPLLQVMVLIGPSFLENNLMVWIECLESTLILWWWEMEKYVHSASYWKQPGCQVGATSFLSAVQPRASCSTQWFRAHHRRQTDLGSNSQCSTFQLLWNLIMKGGDYSKMC